MASYLDDEYDDDILEAIQARREQRARLEAIRGNRSPDPLQIAADLAIGLGGGIAGGMMGTDGGAIAARALELKRRAAESKVKALDSAPELRALVDLARMREMTRRLREGNEFKGGEAEKLRGFKAVEAEKDRGVKREGFQVKEREGEAGRGAAQKRAETMAGAAQRRVETQIAGSQKRTETQADAAMKRLESQQGFVDDRSEADRGNRRKQHVETVIATMKRAGYLPQMSADGDITGWIKDPDYVPKPTGGSGGKPKDESVLNIPGFTRTPGINPTPAEATKLRDALATKKMLDKGLEDYKALVLKHGPFESWGKGSGEMESLATTLQMSLKTLYDLGAITGPDLKIIMSQLTDPVSIRGALTSKKTAIAALDKLKESINLDFQERMAARGFQPQGGSPDPDAKADEWLKSRGLAPSPSPSPSGKRPSREAILQELLRRQQMKKGGSGG